MDVPDRIIYLTGLDGVCRDKTSQIKRVIYDESSSTYQINFNVSDTWHTYKKENVKIVKNSIANPKARAVFDYLKEVASLSEIVNVRSENVLVRNYERLAYVNAESALSFYLNPCDLKKDCLGKSKPIFPFGCNGSQFKAVVNALENPLSVIQGPPGTGKTQTILNIIANLIEQGKRVLVVSNNNSAIENVYEKLSSSKYGLGFLVAPLGKAENIINFIEKQKPEYPSCIGDWRCKIDEQKERERISSEFESLKELFDYQEKAALLKQELSQLGTEYRYFSQSPESNLAVSSDDMSISSSEEIMDLWQKVQGRLDLKPNLSLWFKFILFFKYGIGTWKFWRLTSVSVLALCKKLYLLNRIHELKDEMFEKEELKKKFDLNAVCRSSLVYLKHIISKKCEKAGERRVFSKEEFDREASAFYEEYPVVLSTTFSSRRCIPYFSSSFLFDYVIMDEASQVDVATGALALSCARNVVIVGDEKQLPNVVTQEDKEKANEIFSRHDINSAYDFAENSFLASVVNLFPEVPQTLLREHYRCHPKIINFCNRKFYDNQLIIMTQDYGEPNVISVVRTNEGNHCRGHVNQRQIDVIEQEVLPKASRISENDIGIIAPYRDQAEQIAKSLTGIQADTVHKFQGREKEMIIISTTDNYITSFADDPNLLNVAVSRAKSKLCIVMSGNEQPQGTNIGDLISYINYNNFSITESRVNSIFDYLYTQYSQRRLEYMARFSKISKYDSENLMYGLLMDILEKEEIKNIGIVFEYPLRSLFNVGQIEDLTECERRYVLTDWSHVDFLLYDKVTKTPVLAIEVDGFEYHKKGTKQAERDLIKNGIFEKCGLKLLRCSTSGSGEREKIMQALKS